MALSAEQIEAVFAQGGGAFRCARWGRALAPVVLGAEDETVGLVKAGLQLVAGLAGHEVVETDPELGVNLMVFFLRDWAELSDLSDLEKMIPERDAMVAALTQGDVDSHRVFRFDENGAIKAAFVFLRMGGALEDVPADLLVLGEAVQAHLTWGPEAFSALSMFDMEAGRRVLSADVIALLRAAYDPLLPANAEDASHALRLAARMGAAT